VSGDVEDFLARGGIVAFDGHPIIGDESSGLECYVPLKSLDSAAHDAKLIPFPAAKRPFHFRDFAEPDPGESGRMMAQILEDLQRKHYEKLEQLPTPPAGYHWATEFDTPDLDLRQVNQNSYSITLRWVLRPDIEES
jgi:hypothetical protein